MVVRPMRDHTLKEVAFYNRLFAVPSVFTPAIDTKVSCRTWAGPRPSAWGQRSPAPLGDLSRVHTGSQTSALTAACPAFWEQTQGTPPQCRGGLLSSRKRGCAGGRWVAGPQVPASLGRARRCRTGRTDLGEI